MSDKSGQFKKPEFYDGLVLYFHPYSYYSQKVLLALHEKQIEFTPYVIDVSNGEQFASWFLNLNPKGEVPVLQDGCFIIPDSAHIIGYLENKYSKGKQRRLIPTDISSKEFQKIRFYQRTLKRIPIGAISLGSFIHEDLNLNPKPPFIGPIRKTCLETNEKVNRILKTCANQNDVNSGSLFKKVEFQEKRREIISDRVAYQKLLDALETVLRYIENDLKNNSRQKWLCSDELSIADITLGLMLHRLYSLGFEDYFWTNGKMPYLENYFQNFKSRESFQKSVPTTMSIWKDILRKVPSNYKFGAGVLGMALFAATALAHRV